MHLRQGSSLNHAGPAGLEAASGRAVYPVPPGTSAPQQGTSVLPGLFIHLFYLFIFGCVGSSLLCAWAFSSCGERGLLFVAVLGLLIAVASLVAEHGL